MKRNVKKILLIVAMILPLIYGIFAVLNADDPIKEIYKVSGIVSLILLFISVLASRFKKRMVARLVGFGAFAYACIHFLNFIVLDSQLDIHEFYRQLMKNRFAIIGLISFIFFIIAMVLSFGKLKAKVKIRSIVVYIALLAACIHFFLYPKIPGVWEILALSIASILILIKIFKACNFRIIKR